MKNLLTQSLTIGLILILSGCGSSNNNIIPIENVAPVSNNNQNEVSISNTHYKLIDIIGIGDVYQKKLNDIGIKYADQLLSEAAKRDDREKLAIKTGISHKLILTWVNHIDIMRIRGIGPKQSAWLEAVGVDSIPELAQRVPQNLHERLEIANNIDPNKKFVGRMVGIETVQKWIETAKVTDPLVVVGHDE